MTDDQRTSSASFVVKKGRLYVAYPDCFGAENRSEWTEHQKFAWRWTGLESGNGARLHARTVGDGARVIRLIPKEQRSRAE